MHYVLIAVPLKCVLDSSVALKSTVIFYIFVPIFNCDDVTVKLSIVINTHAHTPR